MLRLLTLAVILTAMIAYPFVAPTYYVNMLSLFLIMGVLALSVDLLWGYTGLLSFGQAAFFGLGGYAYAMSSINLLCQVVPEGLAHYTVTCQPGMTYLPILVAVAVPVLAALVLGYFLFYGRVRGIYFSIVTLCVPLILEHVTTNMVEVQIGNIPIGGYNGITDIPRPSFGLPGLGLLPVDTPVSFYFLVVATAAAVYVFCFWLVRTPFGRTLIAIRENEERTESFGYDVRRYKLWVFAAGAGIAGISGFLFSTMGSYISPWSFNFVLSAESVIWVMLGGRGTLVGPFVGAVIVQLFENLLSSAFLYYWLLILGVGFVVTVLVLPEGIVGLFRQWRSRGAERGVEKALAAEKA